MHILLGLLIAFVIVVIMTRSRRATRACRWREERSGNRGSLRKYQCMACGAEVYCAAKGDPDMCRDPNKRG